jgi:regulator of cell morphogenesis and NO signaling
MQSTNAPYRASDKLRELINDNGALLFVISRFGIPLGFGDKTVGEICAEKGVDVVTFLAVANFASGRQWDESDISLAQLMDYLKRAHVWFLEFNLPSIRRKLIEAIDCSGKDEVALLILRFYDDYVAEVRRHMEHENSTVFAYVESLMKGFLNREYTIETFAAMHANRDSRLSDKLAELKSVIIRYYPQKGNGDLLHSVLFDIINCESDIANHCLVEDQIFVPAVKRAEKSLRSRGAAYGEESIADTECISEQLSQREKEIISCIAKGMTSKEIADKLNLSVHTITTHRRNITSKLQIHNPAGLTIFAIVNKLVSIEEIKLQ